MIPRLRIFAGPNGSGKSTVAAKILERYPATFVNADQIESELQSSGYKVPFDASNLYHQYLSKSRLALDHNLADFIQFDSSQNLLTAKGEINSYHAAAIAEFVRSSLIEKRMDFAFESVFSHPAKLDELAAAARNGYRLYLYYICTEDPQINIERVSLRVELGGHNVSTDKVIARYNRSLALLPSMVEHCYRAFFFDNSGLHQEAAYFANFWAETEEVIFTEDHIPLWFARAFPSL